MGAQASRPFDVVRFCGLGVRSEVGGDGGFIRSGDPVVAAVFCEQRVLVVVVIDESLHVRGQSDAGVVVHPGISARLKAAREGGEHGGLARDGALLPYGRPGEVVVVALVGPVAVGVGCDGLPVDAGQGAVFDDAEFVFAGEVVAYVAVEDLAVAGVGGVLDADEDGDGVAAAGAEDLAAFLAGELAGGALVAAQAVDVDAGVFVGQGQADAVGGVAVDPAAIGDERDDTGVSDAVGRPPKRTQVGICRGCSCSSR